MKLSITVLILLTCSTVQGQFTAQFYPIGEEPTLRWMTSYTSQESVLFEASPIVRFSFFNSMADTLRNDDYRSGAYYLSVRPKLRMYNDVSLPVKTPSYRVFLGTQQMFRLRRQTAPDRFAEFLSVSLESGHYSNGQSECAFATGIPDETSSCDSVYTTIGQDDDLSERLNRDRGNFSTNMTELVFDYRRYRVSADQIPEKMNAFKIGYLLYHNRLFFIGDIGGHSEQDIDIYGRHRLLIGYEFMDIWHWKNDDDFRISFKQNIELIGGAHNHVNPFRSESTITIYPIPQSPAFGFLISYIAGHDNYNFRFVDSGSQLTLGITWDQFPPFPLARKKR